VRYLICAKQAVEWFLLLAAPHTQFVPLGHRQEAFLLHVVFGSLPEEVCGKMHKATFITQLVCIMLAAGLFFGCSDDSPTTPPVDPPIDPPEDTNFAGNIGVYMDAAGLDDNLVDTGDIVQFYVVHKVEHGATASAFKVEAPAGWTLLAANSEFPVSVGNVDEGISIGYARCASGTIHVMTLTYQSPGNTPDGAVFKVLAHNQFPEGIQSVDCQEVLHQDGEGIESPIIDGPPAPGLGGSIGLFMDPEGTNSFLLDKPGLVTYYVVHKVERGATASEFKVEAPSGWTLVSANWEFPVNIGYVETGISIAYGRCATGNIHVGTLMYQSPGTTPAGTRFKVSAHNLYDTVQVVDCLEVLLTDGQGLESPLVK
jgi:hypothetical protein